jgi:hypothetical protein
MEPARRWWAKSFGVCAAQMTVPDAQASEECHPQIVGRKIRVSSALIRGKK